MYWDIVVNMLSLYMCRQHVLGHRGKHAVTLHHVLGHRGKHAVPRRAAGDS